MRISRVTTLSPRAGSPVLWAGSSRPFVSAASSAGFGRAVAPATAVPPPSPLGQRRLVRSRPLTSVLVDHAVALPPDRRPPHKVTPFPRIGWNSLCTRVARSRPASLPPSRHWDAAHTTGPPRTAITRAQPCTPLRARFCVSKPGYRHLGWGSESRAAAAGASPPRRRRTRRDSRLVRPARRGRELCIRPGRS